ARLLLAKGTSKASALTAWPIRAPMLEVSALPGHACPPSVRHSYFAQPRTFQLGCNKEQPTGPLNLHFQQSQISLTGLSERECLKEAR
ncbi:hypothetical protein, partial [Paracoccus sp. SY]|uniref:hypothetical protein n=1 Tax=Paracoccus sp. SY TaxID=1330255 RepID=UPI00195F586B